ncbi:filamentous hemagglutinin N-terminal domain-containing protein [Microcoleus sp. S28C3]|uniref:two-partner secretion domain-containing protein n=1 Tax=Microcoleus sp. S28C3 TaxID=3055414 RepID=UPI002FD73064
MIAQSWFDRCWQWQIGGCVAIFGTLLVGGGEIANAQIVPDNTLGAERSVVTPKVNIRGIPSDRIDGGAIRGANLFHSFEQLSVLEGRGAYFRNPAGIENILSRVTGANRSDILGRLGVLGPANLFLINPNGIVFGPSASLDVQGSFLATTANAVKLGDAGLFSASQPTTSNLLSVSPSALWFNAVAAQPIVNRSQAPSLIHQLNSGGLPPGLQVQPGRTLALVGGDVFLKSGRLTAAGGRIELGSVAGVGEVSLSSSGNNFVLGYDSINNFGNISLSNRAFVDASGEGGGDVQILGGRFSMTQSSNIWANTLGAENGKQVQIRAAEVELSEGSYLRADVTDTGTGTGGDIRIDTGRLLVRDGAQVLTTTFGSGKGGSLQITAAEGVEVIGTSANGQSVSGLYTSTVGSGDAGNLSINTGRLLVRDGAVVSTDTFGLGKGGSLQIMAADSVEVIGESTADGFNGSGLFAGSNFGNGDAGDLSINTRRLLVRDGAVVSAAARGSGNGGSLQITATDSVEVIGTSANGQFTSSLFASNFGNGHAGDLRIDTRRLLVRDGAQVSTDTFGPGKGGSLQITATDSVEAIGRSADGRFSSGLSARNTNSASGEGGDLSINTRRLVVRDGAEVSVDPFGSGSGGSLQITATDSVEVIGGESTANGFNSSGLFARNSNYSGSGDAGILRIDTGRLLVRDGAQVSATTGGSGKGGSLQITATDLVEVMGASADGRVVSGLLASSSGSGEAGDLRIDTGRLLVRDGAAVSSGTTGQGKGGSLQINASDWVALIGRSVDGQLASGLFTDSQGSGDAGNLSINTGRLLVRDGAQVQSGTVSEGNGGSLQIAATDSVEVSGRSADGRFGSRLLADSQGSGNAGDLSINTGRLLVRDGARVSSGTTGQGKGGSLQINASDWVALIGTSANGRVISGLFTESQGSGDAGNLTIDAGRLLVRDGAVVSAATFGSGKGGSLQITATDSVEAIGNSADGQVRSGLFTFSSGSGDAGILRIDAGRLLVRDGAAVSAGTTGSGKGGNLQIKAFDSVEVIGTSANGRVLSGLFTESQGSGDAGILRIDAGRLLVRDGARVSAGTTGSGKGGNLQIKASDSVEVIGTSANGRVLSGLFTESQRNGDAGSLRIDAGRLLVRDGARVSAGTRGSGKGGNLQITAADSVEVIGSSADGQFRSGLFTSSVASGDAGDLRIDTGRLLVRDGAVISSNSTREGTAGNINITARDTLQANNGMIATSADRSSGGSINITAPNIRLSGNSDITSRVNSGAGGGGNIDIKADSILAFDDSDILAFARDGRGGNITLDTRVFFGESYTRAPRNTDPATLDRNNRVDINATGNLASGNIALPDTTSIQNSLTELPENRIDTDSLLASSCIVRRDRPTRGSFTVTGTGGLPQRPGDVQMSDFPTVDVETLPSDTTSSNTNPNRSWQKGDPIVEPQGVYRLPNGKLVMSRECY